MRIAFVYDVLYPEVKGGGEKRLYELGRRLAKRHEVHWYTFGWWGNEKILERDGIVLHSMGKPRPLYRGGIRDPVEAIAFSLRVLGSDIGTYDIIDCQAFPYFSAYTTAFKLFSSMGNLVVTWYEYWGEYWRDYLPVGFNLGKLIENGLLALTGNHIVISKLTLRRLTELTRANFGVVPGGIDFNSIQSILPNPKLEYDAVFVGRLIGHKNVPLLLQSLRFVVKEVPSFNVAIIGNGPQRAELESLAKRLGVQNNVDFLGFLPRFEDVVSIVKASRVFAFPSLREGFGIAVLEANAAGVPAVVVNAPMNASVELITDGKNGYVSTPSPQDFAEKLLLAWENSRRMRRPSISLARRYDWDTIARRLEKYYEGVVNAT